MKSCLDVSRHCVCVCVFSLTENVSWPFLSCVFSEHCSDFLSESRWNVLYPKTFPLSSLLWRLNISSKQWIQNQAVYIWRFVFGSRVSLGPGKSWNVFESFSYVKTRQIVPLFQDQVTPCLTFRPSNRAGQSAALNHSHMSLSGAALHASLCTAARPRSARPGSAYTTQD